MMPGEVHDHSRSIAVIGMACRFPGADSVDRFWRNLAGGVESIRRFSAEELTAAGVDRALLRDPAYVMASPVLDGIDQFDAELFACSPREAALLDPQQRLFLECCWEALEDSGYPPDRCPGSVGVVAGAGSLVGSYFFSQLGAARHLGGAVGGLEYLSNDKDFLATRACFKLNLRGPGLTVQTASSSALVAVHLACQCLLAGDCDVALAGGATVRVPHLAGYLWRDGGILSPDGHCRAFDAAAQGTVLGSGVGVVALKRLAQAVADGDHVEAVILGSAINNDGAAKESFAAPSLAGQAAAIRRALAQAGVGAGTVGYVEAHGSGTPTGDPLELAALAAAFRDQAVTAGRCAVGSVKTNVGHLEAAAGVAALIKTVLALRHGMLPPTLHFSRPNPALALAGSPFFVNTALAGWPASGAPRRAVVNSLGFGGTNACVVLEEAPQASSRRERRRPWGLLRLSAHTPRALDQLAGRFELWLGESGERGAVPPELADVCFTAANGRSELAERAAVVGASSAELRLALADLRSRGAGQPPVPARHARAGRRQAPRVAFLFTGQGAQHPGMGRQLFEHEPVFRRTLETCDEIVGDQLPARLLAAIHGDGAAAALAETRWAQPALFALEVALAELWRSWGIEPALVLGHSIGEYAAACVAGIFDLEEGLRLVVERGRLMQALPGAGAMAAVQASAAWTLETVLGDAGEVTIAALNGPADTVIAGPAAAVEQACARIAAHGVRCRRLAVSHAFHSPLMDPALDELEAACAGVAARAPRLPWICNLTGRPWPEGGFPPAPGAPYWRRHARQPVLFGAGVAAALELGCDAMLEVGPSPALLPMARRVCVAAGRVPAGGPPAPAFLPSLEPRRQDLQVMLESLGRLYVGGATVDWSRVEGKGRRVALPTYPFQRQRHWLETAPATAPAAVLGAEPAPVAVPDERVAADEGAGPLREGLRQADAGARLAAAATFVRGQVCRVLGLRPDQVGRRDRFFDLGLDSLLALDLRAALAAALGPAVRLSSTVVLDFPDVERLARHVADLTESSPQAAAAAGVPLAAAGGGSPRAVEAGHGTGQSAPLEPRRRLRIADPEGAGGEPIAVIGIGCRFPGGASDPEAFWEVIREGRDCVTTVPRNRFDAAALYDPDRDAPGRLYTRHGAFLAECDRFDGDFFGISPREAALLDPQHRLLLEVAWEALERAGQAPDELAGTETGVYLGLSTRDYARLQAAAAAGGARQEDGYGLTGNDFSFAAGRLSYLLGLHGPSVAVDTACSSSLVAIHLACQALRAGECELALAGGVNLILSPDTTLAHCRLHALSPDGRCKVFDAAADGYGRGEGGGVLVLRRLPEARRRREPIVAVVLGSAVNHDGHSAGLTVPSGPAQQRLLRSALRAAGVAPAAVGYVEAHGTGTALGDPIEVQALAAVLAAGRPADRPLAVGSVKACIGHLEAAAGVAGLIKAALVLAKREIPGQPLLRQPNPHIPWHELPLVVPTAAGAFPAGSPRRIAGVSSFGLGGTNAHVVLEEPAAEEPEEPEEPEAEPGWHLLRLSARDEAALAELAARVAAALEAGGGGQRPLRLADVCFTANSCRAELAHRLAVVGRSPAAIAGQLARFAAAGEAPGVWSGPAAADGRGVACVYPGEDAAYAGMARSLFATEPVFRSVMERCAELLAGALDRPLLACLYGGAAALAPGLESQAALFAVEVALAELWRSWGVAGSLHAGAGVGGIAAAWAAGRVDL
ncbi:MAG TPA: beta-ketoacyl synthase N-terminal-like domain-containing protein, partial [Thermoanaerobaculia bacterium]|nr:beta-ketoacyl synthase N-terminal-like domain-containing protein [Thermoanaerobaculia bacterium]